LIKDNIGQTVIIITQLMGMIESFRRPQQVLRNFADFQNENELTADSKAARSLRKYVR
jgi:hypothetical protein